ncbi:AraC family transcriptional regulator [Rubrivivax rivuli]|uniref:AraC family transcriptional regulator n=1 Tax=Rubrivivax rivuli TaxID=1862385 RepID=A0A437RA92_9BURK|nr:AraC family transcriptional regulator [Rubrivivax rivuli]RVU43726.1 AraC family transcriptional regulator [Rubrivivax rivuli]
MPSPLLPPPPADALAATRSALATRLLRQAPGEGLHTLEALPGLMIYRADQLSGSVCGVYEPCVAVVVQGSKRVVLGSDTLVYDSTRYLLTSLNLPTVATILEASPEQPYLALVLKLDLREVATLMLSGTVPAAPPPPREPESQEHRAMGTGLLTLPLLQAFERLLDIAAQPEHAPVLAPLVLREIHYRLLVGEQGGRLRQIAAVGSQGHQIARAIDWLRSHYAEPLRVEDLAREVRMGLSTFHHQFKALTAMSPLQYQKQIRLNEARRLMLVYDLDAATAAYRVGYESPSQFSREYSRQFGAPPVRDISQLRQAPPALLGA